MDTDDIQLMRPVSLFVLQFLEIFYVFPFSFFLTSLSISKVPFFLFSVSLVRTIIHYNHFARVFIFAFNLLNCYDNNYYLNSPSSHMEKKVLVRLVHTDAVALQFACKDLSMQVLYIC
jgi:hypothetical protein